MPFASIYPTDQGPIPVILAKKYWELAVLKNSVLWVSHFGFFHLFASSPWKSVKVSWFEILMITQSCFLTQNNTCAKICNTVYNRDVHVSPRMSGFDILKEQVDTYSFRFISWWWKFWRFAKTPLNNRLQVFLRSIAHFFTQIYMNCFVSS